MTPGEPTFPPELVECVKRARAALAKAGAL